MPQRRCHLHPEMHSEINAQIDHYCSLSFSDRVARLRKRRRGSRELPLTCVCGGPARPDPLRTPAGRNAQPVGGRPLVPDDLLRSAAPRDSERSLLRYHYSEAEYAGLEKSLYDRLAVKIADLGSGKLWRAFFRIRDAPPFQRGHAGHRVVKAFAPAQQTGNSAEHVRRNVQRLPRCEAPHQGDRDHRTRLSKSSGRATLAQPGVLEPLHDEGMANKGIRAKNGIYLTDCIGTDVPARPGRHGMPHVGRLPHDSGDPYAWGERMLAHPPRTIRTRP